MTDGGAIVRELTAKVHGRDAKVIVVVSGNTVEIAGITVDREDLLVALGAPVR